MWYQIVIYSNLQQTTLKFKRGKKSKNGIHLIKLVNFYIKLLYIQTYNKIILNSKRKKRKKQQKIVNRNV